MLFVTVFKGETGSRVQMFCFKGRLGFFNSRVETAMNAYGLSVSELADLVGFGYGHLRKILLGQSLPSDSLLESLCFILNMSLKEMLNCVQKDRIIFLYGDSAWAISGIHPRVGTLHILFPLLSAEEQSFCRLMVRALIGSHKQRVQPTKSKKSVKTISAKMPV
jgi:transcriptional regulator with XRE-family HTH domain